MGNKKRNLKIYNQSQNGKYNVPTIILKGEWLKELGFDCGNPIEVSCQKDKLVISVAANSGEVVNQLV